MQAIGPKGGQQARPLFRAPDVLTVLRLPLAVLFVLLDGTGARLVVLVAASLSDLVDGIWARRIGGSRAGVVLDPVCDKLFVVSAFAVVWQSHVLTILELLGVLMRDIVAAAAFLGTWVRRHPTTLPARAGGKWVTVAQLLTLLAFLAGSELVRPLAWATAAISVYAIADYTRAARLR
ncbi:MAG: CDP-alcohol phosphatidyltransferase family protein [Gemmatimonadota bacterium]|nr:CDP-alcohol phosphatidyltransferase family protein [Gemmatimonadota bacterium]